MGGRFIFVSLLAFIGTSFFKIFSFLLTLYTFGKCETDFLSFTFEDLCSTKLADFFSKLLADFFVGLMSSSVFLNRFESGVSRVCPLGKLPITTKIGFHKI